MLIGFVGTAAILAFVLEERRLYLTIAPRAATLARSICRRSPRAGQVARVGRIAEAHRRLVLFLRAREELRESRRAPHQHDQHARRKRIERARMPHAPLVQDAPHARHHVVRSPVRRFVYDEYAVHEIDLRLAGQNRLLQAGGYCQRHHDPPACSRWF